MTNDNKNNAESGSSGLSSDGASKLRHRLGQPITVIMSCAELLKIRNPSLSKDDGELLDMMKSAAEEIRDIVGAIDG